jgi:hypothetical protein
MKLKSSQQWEMVFGDITSDGPYCIPKQTIMEVFKVLYFYFALFIKFGRRLFRSM